MTSGPAPGSEASAGTTYRQEVDSARSAATEEAEGLPSTAPRNLCHQNQSPRLAGVFEPDSRLLPCAAGKGHNKPLHKPYRIGVSLWVFFPRDNRLQLSDFQHELGARSRRDCARAMAHPLPRLDSFAPEECICTDSVQQGDFPRRYFRCTSQKGNDARTACSTKIPVAPRRPATAQAGADAGQGLQAAKRMRPEGGAGVRGEEGLDARSAGSERIR